MPSSKPPSERGASQRQPTDATSSEVGSERSDNADPGGSESVEEAAETGGTRASEDLIKAGERLLKAGETLMPGSSSSAPSDPLIPNDLSDAAANEPPDALIPESDPETAAEEDTFFNDESSPSSPATSTDSDPLAPKADDAQRSTGALSADPRASTEAMEQTDQPTSVDTNSASHPPQNEDGSMDNNALSEAAEAIYAAGEALVQAGEALDRAEQGSSAPGQAQGDETNTQTELSEAQIALILARASIDEAASDTNMTLEPNQGLLEASSLLDQAAEAIARATLGIQSKDDGRFQSGRETDRSLNGSRQNGTDQRIAELDAELNASIAVFASDMQSVREATSAALSGKTPTAVAAPGDFGRGVNTSSGELRADGETASSSANPGLNQDESGGESDAEDMVTGRTPDGRRFESPEPPEDLDIPNDIPSPQGDDIVAQQLREAAIAERDPELKAKLWEEYRRYTGKGASSASSRNRTSKQRAERQASATNIPPAADNQMKEVPGTTPTAENVAQQSGSKGEEGPGPDEIDQIGTSSNSANDTVEDNDQIQVAAEEDEKARELREAAEAEEDPERKKRLLEQYEKYKSKLSKLSKLKGLIFRR